MDERRRASSYFTWRYPSKKAELANDSLFVLGPHRIGNSILIYGRKNTHFPFQAFVSHIIVWNIHSLLVYFTIVNARRLVLIGRVCV